MDKKNNEELKKVKRINRKAKKTRRDPTAAEIKLAEVLKNNEFGYKFLRHEPIEGHLVDFYCARLNLAILIDGNVELENKKVKGLKRLGINVLRYSSKDIIKNTEFVIFDLMSNF